MKFLKRHYPLLIILAVSGIYFFSRLGRDLLFDWDECIYATYTHTMKANHSFLINLFNGNNLFDKPPLYMWMLSAATVFGENEFTFRFLSALATLALVIAVYLFTSRYFTRRIAVIATLLLLTSETIVSHAVLVNTDIFFTLFVFLAVWGWIASFEKKSSRWLPYVCGTLLGLGVMVKSLGSLQFLAVLFLCALLEQRREALVKYLKVLVSFLIVIAPWHLAVLILYQRDFIHQYIGDNIIKRSTHVIENHQEHWYFYFKQIAYELFPWIVFATIIPFFVYRRFKGSRTLKDLRIAWVRGRVMFILLLMVVLPLLSITRVASKVSWYAMPIYPFLVIVLAYYIAIFLKKFLTNVMQGNSGMSLINVMYAVVFLLAAIDAFTALSHYIHITDATRRVSQRDQAILKTKDFPDKALEYLVPFGERQGRAALPPEATLEQTFKYGGNACAVYYSQKHVDYIYSTDEFLQKVKTAPGLYLIENGDLHYIDNIQNKKILFKNIEYTLFRMP